MKVAKIAELKNRLSYYIDQVRRGETILVLDRDAPVARIVPPGGPTPSGSQDQARWLRRKEAAGILRCGNMRGVAEILNTLPPGKASARVVEALIEDRQRR